MWNKVSPLELGLARATLLEESLYQKELWMQPPPYTNKTVLFEICSEWLGESQNRAYRSMMRKVLQVAQMEVDMKELQEANRAERTSAGDDGLRNKRSSELQRPMLLSLIDNRSFKRVFRRKKRQSSDQLELKTIRVSFLVVVWY